MRNSKWCRRTPTATDRREVGGDHDRGLLVELADEVEQQLAAGERERQVAELVEDHEVEPREMVGDAAGLSLRPTLRRWAVLVTGVLANLL
jgi:hypothetical protein